MARAYSHPVDWGGALYQHCIVQGEVSYLTDFMYNMSLTSALVEDVARRLVFMQSLHWWHLPAQLACTALA